MDKSVKSWTQARQLVDVPDDGIYLNSGSFSLLPYRVRDKTTRLRLSLSRQPSDFLWRQAPPLIETARQRLADHLNLSSSGLLLLPNVTFAINMVVRSLDLPPGSEILCTNQEYGAMRFCWQERANPNRWTVRQAELPLSPAHPDELIAAVQSQLSEKTKVLFFSHVTSPTGLVFPARQLCQLARQRGILSVVDGAHAPGMIPLDLNAVDADFYGGNCHKWLMAPTGAGFLAVRAEHKQTLRPLITSWGWEYAKEMMEKDSGWGGSFWARDLEFHGTQDRCAQMVIPEALDFREELGDQTLMDRAKELAGVVRTLATESNYEVITPPHPELHGSLTAITVPPLDPVAARNWMWRENRIEAPFTIVGDRCFFRISTAWFNTQQEIEQAFVALRRLPLAELQPS